MRINPIMTTAPSINPSPLLGLPTLMALQGQAMAPPPTPGYAGMAVHLASHAGNPLLAQLFARRYAQRAAVYDRWDQARQVGRHQQRHHMRLQTDEDYRLRHGQRQQMATQLGFLRQLRAIQQQMARAGFLERTAQRQQMMGGTPIVRNVTP